MDNQKAKQVLTALLQGTDPVTGTELPGESICNRIEVSRALLVAIMALEDMAARKARRAQLPVSVGTTWSPQEEANLAAEVRNGEAIEEIAKRHGRTVRAIWARLERLGLLTEEQRGVYGAFPVQKPTKRRGRKRRQALQK
jgi:transposase-like protein